MIEFVVGIVMLLSMWLGPDHTDKHSNSPADYGTRARSTLQSGSVPDSRNCVGKTNVGEYQAVGKSYRNGNVTDTVRADAFGEVNCHPTGVNNDAHAAGVDHGGPVLMGNKSKH